MNYKAPDNSLYFINPDYAYLLPEGCIHITEDEATSIRNLAMQKKLDVMTYAEKRQSEYPPYTDYLDGIVKGDNAQVQAYIDACNAVKNKYPKGTA
jgi:hypothetical protein